MVQDRCVLPLPSHSYSNGNADSQVGNLLRSGIATQLISLISMSINMPTLHEKNTIFRVKERSKRIKIRSVVHIVNLNTDSLPRFELFFCYFSLIAVQILLETFVLSLPLLVSFPLCCSFADFRFRRRLFLLSPILHFSLVVSHWMVDELALLCPCIPSSKDEPLRQ